MAAPNTTRQFIPDQSVRLLIAYFAWRYSAGTSLVRPNPNAYQRGGSDGPAARTLRPDEALRFVRYRHDVPGSCLVADARGRAWICPLDFLTAGVQ